MQGKVAVVTGGAAGIGRGICELLGARGARIVVADLDGDAAQRTASELQGRSIDATAVQVDVSSATEARQLVDRVVDTCGGIDVLVNNAGIATTAPALEMAAESWQRVIDVNLNGVFFCSRAAARIMIERGHGRIVNVASSTAHVASPGYAAYCASKGAVVSLTRALAVEWSPLGVLVNSVSPGAVQTDMSERVRLQDPMKFEKRAGRVPVRRPGTVGDVAAVVAFLASDEAGYVSGRDILVDGGMLALHPGYVD